MGNKISGLLADVFMDNVESPLVSRPSIGFFCRYVDDCLIITTSKEEAIKLYDDFNKADNHIKYEVEYPGEDGSLALLDFKLHFSDSGPHFAPHTKSAKSDVFLSGDSFLPQRSIKNIVLNEWERIKHRCENPKMIRQEKNRFLSKLQRNRHTNITSNMLSKRKRSDGTKQTNPTFFLSVPFVSDSTDTMLRRLLKPLGYNIMISHKGRNLAQQLYKSSANIPTRNNNCNLSNCFIKNPSLCFKPMAVYKAECIKCKNFYIGSTKKQLHHRIKEHFTMRTSQIYVHNFKCNGKWDFTIIATGKSIPDLRWKEAILISQLKPQLNVKEENNGISSLLLL
jgi:hypothetical protein